MTRAAFFLITHNLKNRFVRSVTRLRQPRYVMGAALGVLYFYSILFRAHVRRDVAHLQHGPGNEMMVLVVTILAFFLLVLAWAMPGDEPGLVFSEAEIQFFFAGPVSRRQLIAYKLVRSQVQSLFSAVIFAFFAFRGSHVLGVWLCFAVLDVYNTFVSFVRARLKLSGIGWLWRAAAVTIVLLIIGSIASHQIRSQSQTIVDAFMYSRKASFVDTVVRAVWAPPLGTILFLPGLFGRTAYAPAPWTSAAILLLFGLAVFFLLTQMDVSFEDASIVASQRALTRRARLRGLRSGRTSSAVHRFPPPFKLAEGGRPEVAVVWKNLIGTLRTSSFPILALVLPLAAAAGASIFGKKQGIPDAIGLMGLICAGMFVFLGPIAVRTDLRTDMLRLDVIKAFPLSAEALLAAELAAPLAVISLFELGMILMSIFALQFGGHYFAFFTMPEFIVSALVFIIPIVAIQLLIQNAGVMLFPAWTMTADSRGFTAAGQRLLMLLGNFLVLTLALIPAAIVFAPTLWLSHKLLGNSPFGILVATIPAAALLVGEVFLGHKVLASQFEDLDIANDLDAITPE